MTPSDPKNSAGSSGGSRADSAAQAIIGREIGGDFLIRRKIGQGGMGTVYEAWQNSLRRIVAIKILSNSAGLTENAIARFQLEAQAAAKLHHTNIVPIFAQGEHEGLYYYAMELVPGFSLNELIASLRGESPKPLDLTATRVVSTDGTGGGSLDGSAASSGGGDSGSSLSSVLSQASQMRFDRVAEMIASAADGLEYAHAHGVIHRDIKPHNFLCGEDGRLRIADFGLARVLEQPGMTVTGEFVGSPLYMSPEQITGSSADVGPHTDIYSLGATLYEWLVLRPPFPGETREQVISRIVQEEPAPPRSVNPKIPVDLETICLKALQKSPNRRYAAAADMAADLRRFVARQAINAKREGVFGKLGKFVGRNRGAVLVAGILVAVGSLLWGLQSKRVNVLSEQKEEVIASNRDAQKRANAAEERVDQLEEEKRRLTETLGNAPIESGLAQLGADVLGDVADAFRASVSFDVGDGELASAPTPENIDENIDLASEDRRLIDLFVEEFLQAMRRDERRVAEMSSSGNPVDERAAMYFREALLADGVEQALSLANLTLQSQFDHSGALQLRSLLNLARGEYDKAIADANLLVNVRGDSSAGFLVRGLVRFFAGQRAESLADLNRAVQIEPRNPVVWVSRGAVRSRLGQYITAIDDFQTATGLVPLHVAATEERALALDRLRTFVTKELAERIEQDSTNYELRIQRGDLFYYLGEYDNAMADFSTASNLVEEPPSTLIGKLYMTQQRLRDAKRPVSDAKPQASARPHRESVIKPVPITFRAFVVRFVGDWIRG